MIYIRRMWLLPTILATTILYFFFRSTGRVPDYSFLPKPRQLHLKPRPEKHPVTSFLSAPTEAAKAIPRIQFTFEQYPEPAEAKKSRSERQDAVKETFQHAWTGYKKYAWAKDEVAPITGVPRNSFGGWGATLVDTLDTLWIMGLREEFDACITDVDRIDFSTNTEKDLNVFETTIRYLGGLLAAYDISDGRYPSLLRKAKELGDILYMTFDTPNRMPVTRWDWRVTAKGGDLEQSTRMIVAELGSMSLEFTRLAQLTHDPKYFDAIQRITEEMYHLQNQTKLPGLWPTIVNTKDLDFSTNHFTFGGMSDSAYEYLPKEYMLLGGLDDTYKVMYETAIEAGKRHLFFRPLTPNNADILFSGNAGLNASLMPAIEAQGQHLACFVGGMVGIGSRIFDRPDDLSVARRLVDGCIWAYDQLPSGLMPEVFQLAICHAGVETDLDEDCAWSDDKWYEAIAARFPAIEQTQSMTTVEQGEHWAKQLSLFKGFTDHTDNRYILRPEAIESVFILYRITGDASLLDSAWKMFQSIEQATRTEIAHAGLYDVRAVPPVKSDRMESFWLAETLKYFYLIFADPSEVNLDEWVFNTEAHPFKRPKPGYKFT